MSMYVTPKIYCKKMTKKYLQATKNSVYYRQNL